MDEKIAEGVWSQLDLQRERLKNESGLKGWNSCRFLHESGNRCGAVPLYGGYCDSHLLDYPYPRLLKNPRDRWRDSAVIASSATNVSILLKWLVQRKELEDARYLVSERAELIESGIRRHMAVTGETVELFNEFYNEVPLQALQFRIYLVLQPKHDIGYDAAIKELEGAGVLGF